MFLFSIQTVSDFIPTVTTNRAIWNNPFERRVYSVTCQPVVGQRDLELVTTKTDPW
jgi:hypothetical protein